MKLSKKILSIVLSVLMVVSTIPFTAVTALAADTNYEAVKTAITAYETKMNDAKNGGMIYTNMPAAYSAYVDANKALKKACAGETVDLANAASKLTEATGKMETYTAPGFTTVAPTFNSNAIGSGYYGNVIYAGTDITDISGGDGNELNSYGIAGNRLYGKMHCNRDIVLVYDGNKDALKLPVTVQFIVKRSIAGTPRFKVASVYSNGGSWTLYQDWFGNSGAWNTWPSSTNAKINYVENGWDDGKLLDYNQKGGTTYYYGNCVKYSGTPDDTVYYNHYNKGSDLNFTVYSQGDYSNNYIKNVNLSPIQADGDANIYVLNYQGFKNLVANSLKDKDVNVADYKNGGLTAYLNQIDTASKYSPDNAKTGVANGSDVAKAFSKVATDLKNAEKPAAETFEITHSSSSKVSNWTVTKAATCKEAGSKTGNCDYCGTEITAEIPIDQDAHSYLTNANPNYTSNSEKANDIIYQHAISCDNDASHAKKNDACTFERAIELDVAATETTEGKEYERCSVCGGTRYTVIEKLAPEITFDVVDRENSTDTSSKVDVAISKNAENETVVKAEIKPEDKANGTKFIGWYDNEGKLVSPKPEYVVTDTSKPLTVKTADRANDGYSLGMNGKVDCHLYIDTLYYVDDVDNTTIEISYNQNGTTYAPDVVTKTMSGTQVINNGDEFLFTTGYAPVQITEQISYKVYENGTLVYDSDVANANASIEKYCAAVINAGVYSTELTNLCQSVINYGSAAQNYFVGVTAPAVTATTTDVANLTTADVEAYKPTIQQTSASRADFQVTDMTFMSLDNSAIRFYYTGSLDGYTVTVDAAEVTPQSKVVNGETYNYFEVSGIAAADLDAFHDIRIVKDGKIAFYAKASALSYVYLGVNNAPGALKNYKTFLATLVDYNVKNKEYKASKA